MLGFVTIRLVDAEGSIGRRVGAESSMRWVIAGWPSTLSPRWLRRLGLGVSPFKKGLPPHRPTASILGSHLGTLRL